MTKSAGRSCNGSRAKCKAFELQASSATTLDAKNAFGPSLSGRRGIFLGQANAANAPVASLESALASIAEAFPCEFRDHREERRHPYGFERVSSLMDTFSQLKRPLADWRRLQNMGLRALYLGVESGSSKVLKLLQKPGHLRFDPFPKGPATTLYDIGQFVY